MTDLRIALGTIPFGTSVDDSTSFDLLDRFVGGGGTRIDTANNYPFWVDGASGDESGLALGRWLVSRRTRDRVVLGTKCGGRPTNGRTLDSTEGLSAPAIRHTVEGSLRRLQTDSIDVYWAHVEDRSMPLEETVGAFDELAAQGVVREVGASNLPTWRLERGRQTARALGVQPWTHIQVRHTYLQPRPGVRLPEAGHTLVTPEMLDYVSVEPDLTLWAYNTLLVGVTRVSQLDEALAGARLELGDDLLARLDEPA